MTDFTTTGFNALGGAERHGDDHPRSGSSARCRIDRTSPMGFIVSHPDQPGLRLTAPNIPTAYALCQRLEGLRPRLIPDS